MSQNSVFDKAYWLHQPPPVRELRDLPEDDGTFGSIQGSSRQKRAIELATKGYEIDIPIMLWSWDPYLIMGYRKQFGFTGVPSALETGAALAPTLGGPTKAGSILVSQDPKDYPPFDPPAPPPPPAIPLKTLVGVDLGGGVYVGLHAKGILHDGQTYEEKDYEDLDGHHAGRGIFLFHQVASPFNPNGGVVWFTLDTPAVLAG